MDGRWYRRFWAAWAALLAAGFAVVEWMALSGQRHERDTLSANVQHVVRHDRHPLVRWGTAAGFAAFSAWFVHHIWID